MGKRERRMVGHGAIVMVIGLIAGFGLIISLIGGFEILPGWIVEFEIFGDSGAWARAHAGGLMNGLMVFVGALLIYAMRLPERAAFHLRWMLVGAGYGNTVFYWGGLLASNRALTFGDNRFGEANLASLLGLLPAFVFAFVILAAMAILIAHAFGGDGQ